MRSVWIPAGSARDKDKQEREKAEKEREKQEKAEKEKQEREKEKEAEKEKEEEQPKKKRARLDITVESVRNPNSYPICNGFSLWILLQEYFQNIFMYWNDWSVGSIQACSNLCLSSMSNHNFCMKFHVTCKYLLFFPDNYLFWLFFDHA